MTSFAKPREALLSIMIVSLRPFMRPLAFALAAVALSAATGLAFAGWMEHSPAIFMTLVEQGLAWCF